MSRYRTGPTLGRTVYRDDELIGRMHTAEDSALVVELLNARERVLGAPARGTSDTSPHLGVDDPTDPCESCGGNRLDVPPGPCLLLNNHPCDPARGWHSTPHRGCWL